jgi:hypothetical protein
MYLRKSTPVKQPTIENSVIPTLTPVTVDFKFTNPNGPTMLVMKWNTAINGLPKHGQEVLISVNASYNIANYNAKEKQFELKGGANFKVGEHDIHWAELIDPTVR